MRRLSVVRSCVALIACIALAGSAQAGWNVSEVAGGPLKLAIKNSAVVPGPNRTLEVTFTGTNASSQTIPGVQFLYCFTWTYEQADPQPAFAWNNSLQRFEQGSLWVKPIATLPTANTYEVMNTTNLPLSFNNNDPTKYQTATLNATDSVPTENLGDFAPFESKDFVFTVQTTPGTWAFESTGFFVAVPEPGSLMALAMGLAGLAGLRRRR